MKRLYLLLQSRCATLYARLPQSLRHFLSALRLAVVRAARQEATMISGHVAFSAFLSLFPFAAALAATAGFFGEAGAADSAIESILAVLPQDIAQALSPILHDVMGRRQGDLLTFSILATLYAAGSGVSALRLSLNRAYRRRETRSWWVLLLENAAVVIAGLLFLLLISFAVILAPLAWSVLEPLYPDFLEEQTWHLLRLAFAGLICILAVLALHWVLPDCWFKLKQLWPGAVLTAFVWFFLAKGFALYLATIGRYSLTYGTLAGVAALLIYLYLSAFVFQLGAYFNVAWRAKPKGVKAPLG